MSEDALELIKLRNSFYRDNYRRLSVALLVCLFTILALVGMLFMALNNKPVPKYFATTDDGRILPLIPLNVPYKTSDQVLQWSTEAAITANTYDFVNYRKQLQDAGNYFTPTGWISFMKALQESNNLEAIKVGKVIATAEPMGAPQISEEGLMQGVYYWKVTLPMQVNYQGPSLQQKNNFVITMTIVRISTLDNPDGVGIQQMILEQAPLGKVAGT